MFLQESSLSAAYRRIGAGFCGSVWGVSRDDCSSVVIKREDGGPGRSLYNDFRIHEILIAAHNECSEQVSFGITFCSGFQYLFWKRVCVSLSHLAYNNPMDLSKLLNDQERNKKLTERNPLDPRRLPDSSMLWVYLRLRFWLDQFLGPVSKRIYRLQHPDDSKDSTISGAGPSHTHQHLLPPFSDRRYQSRYQQF